MANTVIEAHCGSARAPLRRWRWEWVREVRELVFALDADAAGQQQWRQLARQAALRGSLWRCWNQRRMGATKRSMRCG